MFSLEIILLGMALAIDAGVVTFAIGLLHQNEAKSQKIKSALLVASTFGFFQFLMLWSGSYCGYLFTFSTLGYYFQIGAGFLFLALALKCFHESTDSEDKNIVWGLTPVLILAFVTSIDAFISGMSLGTAPRPILSAIEVGMITFIICSGFYGLGQVFKKIPDRWLLRFAGLIFIFLGAQIMWTYKTILFRG
jgi:putative Mn2+ efflux pump MntP